MAEGADKPEFQWTPDERRVVNQDQRLKSIIISCLLDDIIKSTINYETTKDTWTDLVLSFEGPSNTKENRIMDLKLEYQTFRVKTSKSLSQTYTRYKTVLNELANDGDFQENSNDEVDERTSEEYLRDLDIEFHERALLANLKCFIKRKNNFSIQKANKDTECYKCGKKVLKGFQPKFTLKFIQSTQHAQSSQGAKTFNWDEEEVSNDEEETRVQVLMSLADDELSVGKNNARNGEWVDITIRKVNILVSIDEDSNWQSASDLLALKQAKLKAYTFQIQNIEPTKLNHALQDQLKEEKNVNEKWLNSSNKVSQCISEQIPNQKKKILSGEQLTESSSKNDAKDNPFIPTSLDYDHEMVLKLITSNSSTSTEKSSGSFSKLGANDLDLQGSLSKGDIWSGNNETYKA
ncbi:hypothetical protein Tco_0601786 [Tanacetum coccineum]